MCRGAEAHGYCAGFIDGGLLRLAKHAVFGEGDVIHLHWISSAVTFESLMGAWLRLAVFHSSLLIWRLRGKKILWTVHNLINHEKRRAWLDQTNSMLVARLAHHLLVHGESARPIVARAFRVSEKKIHVVHHGNYDGIVTPQELDTEHEGVRFLFFGMIRPYKGVPDLMRAFRQVDGVHRLHIAGQVVGEKLEREITAESAKDGRISQEFAFTTDKELARLLAWADVVVLPFRDILTSGSLLMALTAGRPVVAPRIGLIPEYADEASAFFYNPADSEGLVSAMRRASVATDLPLKARAARQRALNFRWEDIGAQLAEIYRGEASVPLRKGTDR